MIEDTYRPGEPLILQFEPKSISLVIREDGTNQQVRIVFPHSFPHNGGPPHNVREFSPRQCASYRRSASSMSPASRSTTEVLSTARMARLRASRAPSGLWLRI